jgi:hypothetical protein
MQIVDGCRLQLVSTWQIPFTRKLGVDRVTNARIVAQVGHFLLPNSDVVYPLVFFVVWM